MTDSPMPLDPEDLKVPIPLYTQDLTVLEWFAAWTPKVHKAAWDRRKAWPPGFREMADLSIPGFSDRNNTVANAEAEMKAGPLLPGDTAHKRRGAMARLPKLLAYRLIEGAGYTYRLTARGRAALKRYGRECPDAFKSHCAAIFDDVSLLPRNGINTRIDFDDRLMGRVGPAYKVKHGEALPDDRTTWDLMLAEYSEDTYRGKGTLTGASATLLPCQTTGRHLNGSLREHYNYVNLAVQDEHGRRAFEMALSLEGLADLLVSQGQVPCTIDSTWGPDGMRYSYPAPPPVSVARRMKERIASGNQDIQNRVAKAIALLDEAKMGQRAKAEIKDILGLVARDVPTHGAFAAQQAMEEVSKVAESMMTVMADKAQLAGVSPTGLLLGGSTPKARLLTDGSDPEDA
jgi:hypothetical protein